MLKPDIAKRFGRRPLLLAVVVIAAITLNPLGLTSASSRASENIIARFLAPFYDSNPQPITVVLFDDASLRELGLSWPPPYRVTVALLRKVLCANPRAVFLDLLFTHEHEGEPPGAFENLVLNLSGDRGSCRGAPIYVADMADQVHYPVPGNSVVHERLRETPKIRRVPANWVADEGLYPLAMRTIDPSSWPTALGDEERYLPSPAFALYRLEVPDAEPEDFDEPMVIRWGYTPQAPPENTGIDFQGYCAEARSARSEGEDRRQKVLAALGQLMIDVFRVLDSPGPRQSCPYSFFVSAHTVLEGNSGEGQPLHAMFNQRYVLIGTRLDGSGDVVVSPVHGQLPGVFSHAMALDNLLRDRDRYWRPMPAMGNDWPLSQISLENVVTTLLIATLVLLSMGLFQPWRLAQHAAGRHGRASALLALELAVAFVLIAIVVFALVRLHYPPINWIGVLALLIVAIKLSGMVKPEATSAPPHPQPSKER